MRFSVPQVRVGVAREQVLLKNEAGSGRKMGSGVCSNSL